MQLVQSALLDRRAQPASLVRLVQLDCLATLESVEALDRRVLQATLVPPDFKGFQVEVAQLEQPVQADQSAARDYQELVAYSDRQDPMVARV